eukprot:SAG11_NODE_6965_length_1218_cov_1.237712_3_plen_85_part_01
MTQCPASAEREEEIFTRIQQFLLGKAAKENSQIASGAAAGKGGADSVRRSGRATRRRASIAQPSAADAIALQELQKAAATTAASE